MSRNDDYVPFSFAGHADREEAAFLLSLIPLVAAGEGAHKPCAKCGKPVCILEDCGPGAELSDGRWACSEECWDALAGPPDAPSVVQLHGLWRTDMENAPTDTLLAVRAGGMTFDASLRTMTGCGSARTAGTPVGMRVRLNGRSSGAKPRRRRTMDG